MIQANELRIGNYVYNEITKRVFEVYPMMIPQLFRIQSEEHNIKPIPLTEQWLYDLGFDEDLELSGFCVNLIENGVFIDLNQGQMLSGIFVENIKHVHQLQNLYFALTGKELTKQKSTL